MTLGKVTLGSARALTVLTLLIAATGVGCGWHGWLDGHGGGGDNGHPGAGTGAAADAGSPAKKCGGILGLQCPADQYCNFPIGTQCGSGDQQGACSDPADLCSQLVAPVCGCDGKTYPNACIASQRSMSVLHEGACDDGASDAGTTAQKCGGLLGVQCPAGQFCNFPIATQCGSGDQQGACEVPPQICNKIFQPVCGCDGNTYGNSCEAAAASESIVSQGACK